jgi:hypothetical protein
MNLPVTRGAALLLAYVPYNPPVGSFLNAREMSMYLNVSIITMFTV